MTVARVLITGAAGFVGRHLLPVLRSAFPGVSLIESAFDVTEARAGVEAAKAYMGRRDR